MLWQPENHSGVRKLDIRVGQKRVARIMREHGLRAVKARMYRTKPIADTFKRASPNRIHDLKIKRMNQVWVGDITYIKMPDNSWQYLSVIMDRFSRRVVAWALGAQRTAALTCRTLAQAVKNRGTPANLIFHSDKGIEYVAKSFRKKLKDYGIQQSMNRVKEMNDNAHIESFFQHFKTERIKRRVFKTPEQLKGIICEYMLYYNFHRSHSMIGYVAPNEFESKIK